MNTPAKPTTEVELLVPVWEAAWRDLDLPVPQTDVRQRLQAAYAEPQRHHHSLQHLAECLVHFSALRHLATHPVEVALALWFHDAVYDPQGKDNEAMSARWADAVLAQTGAIRPCRDRVHALIMATCHQASPSGTDERLLVDIDLAILGAAPARFDEYDRQVRPGVPLGARLPVPPQTPRGAAVLSRSSAHLQHGSLQAQP